MRKWKERDYNQNYGLVTVQLEEMLHRLQNHSHIYIYNAGEREKEVLKM